MAPSIIAAAATILLAEEIVAYQQVDAIQLLQAPIEQLAQLWQRLAAQRLADGVKKAMIVGARRNLAQTDSLELE